MHVLRERLYLFERCVGQHAVAQIEDVSRSSAGSSQHIVCRGEQEVARTEQPRRIQVALDGAVVTDDEPGLVQGKTPVEADDVAAGFRDVGKDCRRAHAEVHDRYPRVPERRE